MVKYVTFDNNWPENWKYVYPYDQTELWGKHGNNIGYFYSFENRRIQSLKLITEVLKPGATILDVAAAQGNFSLWLAERGFRVTWNDLRTDLADYTRLKYEFGEIEYLPGNIFELTVDEQFDCVLIMEVIEHVAHPDEFLCKIFSMVKPGGYVVMTTPNGRYIMNTLPRFSDCKDTKSFEAVQFGPSSDGHIFLLWPDEVISLAEQAGFVVEHASQITSPLCAGHMKFHWILPLLPRAIVNGIEKSCTMLPNAVKTRLFSQTVARFRRSA